MISRHNISYICYNIPITRGVQSPEYQLVGPGNKFLLATSQLQCGEVCDRTIDSPPPPPVLSRSQSQTSSVPDITRRVGLFPNHNTDPYGPMSGRNLVVENMEEAEEEGENISYRLPQQTYQSYCDLHHSRHRPGTSELSSPQ